MSESSAAAAVADDYADALLACRRARTLLGILILLAMACVVGLFAWARYGNLLSQSCPPAARQAAGAALGAAGFMSLVLAIVLAAVVLVAVNIMLVGRLVGVSRVIGGFFWCVLLVVLLSPWRAIAGGTGPGASGVVCAWEDLPAAAPRAAPTTGAAPAASGAMAEARLWLRFAGPPVLIAAITLVIFQRTGRGLRQAMGEAPSPT